MKRFTSFFLTLTLFTALPLGAIAQASLKIQAVKKPAALEFSFAEALVALEIPPIAIADDKEPQRILPFIQEQITDSYTSLGMRKWPSLETLSQLKPDLILADVRRHRLIYEQLSQVAPTLLLEGLGEDYQTNLQTFQLIAQTLGQEKRYQKVMKNFRAQMAKFRQEFTALKDKRILFVVTWENGVHVHTPKSYLFGLFNQLGLNYLLSNPSDFTKASEKISFEQLLKYNPDLLIVARRPQPVLLDQWKQSPLWNHLKAAKTGKIYSVDQTLWTRYRGVLSAQVMAAKLSKLLKQGSTDP